MIRFGFLKLKILILVILSLTTIIILLTKGGNKQNLSKYVDLSTNQSLKLFCFVLWKPSNYDEQTKKEKLIWLKECDGYYFAQRVPSGISQHDRESFEPIDETNATLTAEQIEQIEKTYAETTNVIFESLRDIYLNFGDFHWYLKADEDTYIFMHNLKTFLSTKHSNLPVTYGYDLKGRVDLKEPALFHSGGAGYVLSQGALKKLGKKFEKDFSFCENHANEDVDVMRCLNKIEVFPSKSIDDTRERFHPFDVTRSLNGPMPDWWLQTAGNEIRLKRECCSNQTISFHYMSFDEMAKLDQLYELYLTRNEQLIEFTTILYELIY